MKVIVKRFCLSHNGELYKAGDVVEIEDIKTAKRLIAHSGGTLEIYHGEKIEGVNVTDNNDTDDDASDGGASDDVSDSDSENGAGELPAVDLAAAVQTDGELAKRKGEGKKK